MRGLTLDRVIVGTDDAAAGVETLSNLFGFEFGDLIDGTTLDRYTVGYPGIELAEPGDFEGEIADIIREAGPGLAGVAFRVADLEEATTELAAKGLEPFHEIPMPHAKEVLFRLEEFGDMFVILMEYDHPVEIRE